MSKLLRDIPIERQIAKQMQSWEQRRVERERLVQPTLRRQPVKFGPYISVSRELGSGGTELSWRLAEKLGWECFDRQIIEAIADKTHVREELVARFDEHVRSQLDTYLQNLFTGQVFDSTHYIRQLSQVLLGIAQYGNAVIVGRGANFILPPEAGLRVRVVAPFELRAQNLMKELGLEVKRARQELLLHDKEQRAFFQRYFRCKLDDPCAHDVVLNTADLELEAAVDLIIHLAEAKLKTPLRATAAP